MLDKIFRLQDKEIAEPVKASFAFTFCNVFQKGLSVIAVPVFTRLLSTEDYGTYSMFSSWYWILVVFTSLNMFEESLSNAMIKYSDDRDGYTSSVFFLSCVITMIIGFFFFLFGKYLFPRMGINCILGIMLFVQLLLNPALNFWTNRNRFDYNYRNVVLVTCVSSLLALLMSILLAFCFPEELRLLIRIGSMVFVQALTGLIIGGILLKKGKRLFCKEYWYFALSFNIPLIPYYLSVTLLNHADRLMINSFCGEEATALYSLAYSVSTLTILITNGIYSSINPWIYKTLDEKKYHTNVSKKLNTVYTIVMTIIMGFILVSPEIIKIFASNKYSESVYILAPIASSVFFIFVSQCLSCVEFFLEKKKYVMLMSIIVAIINIILNYCFIPVFGYYAAAYTTLACYVILMIGHMFYLKRMQHSAIISTIFDTKHVLLLSTIIIIFTVLVNLIYNNLSIRYIVFAALCIALMIIKGREDNLDRFK